MDFQSEYDTATDGINTLLSTQVGSSLQWTNVPGTLVKSSASAAGFVWGYNASNGVFVCQLPCTGNWTMIDTSKWNLSNVLDITTDGSNVYVLISTTDGKTVMYSTSASNTGTWTMIPVPFSATKLFSTHTYIWAQDASNNKQKCPKPCTMSNWIANPENKIKITSSSDNALYGVDASGNAVKTDENLQSEWSSISGLSGLKLMTVVGQADSTALYGVDTASKAYRCEGNCMTPEEVDPLDTGGYAPLNMSADPSGKSIWMTGTTSGGVGNIFNRLDKPDYTSIMNNINPLEQNREKTVSKVTDEYNKQTNSMIANKQVTEVVNFFTKFFKFDKQTAEQEKSNISAYKDKLVRDQATMDQMTSLEPVVLKLIMLLGVVAVIYMLGGILRTLTHTIAFVILVIGLGYIIYSSG